MNLRTQWHMLAALVVGMVAFFLIVGPGVLNTQNIGWLTRGDATQHYIGWAYFRDAPWSTPLGTNPGYGMELSSSIVYSDSNPLFALAFKPFDAYLPETFQYFGIWLLVCFLAQAVFSYLLAGIYTDNLAVRLICTGFFATALPMINRITANTNNNAHLSLVGHFFIVAALYFFLKPRRAQDQLFWIVLLGLATAVHAYLAALVAFLWLGSLVRSVLRGETILVVAGASVLVGLAVAIGVAWQVGYFFVGSDFVSWGFGYYNYNLLAPITTHGWSYIIPHIGDFGGDYEGFAYLGLGILALIFAGFFRNRHLFHDACNTLRADPVLMLMIVGLGLFAAANTIAIGPVGITLPMPDSLKKALVFRSSGRMIWPVYYLVLLAVIIGVHRLFGSRRSPWVLGLALVMQLVDSSVVWGPVRAYLNKEPAARWETPLQHPFWAFATENYTAIRSVDPGGPFFDWHYFADLAQRSGVPTDIVYVARYDREALAQRKDDLATMITSGDYPLDELFVVPDEVYEKVVLGHDRSRDLLAHIDGYHVLAPGWINCAPCLEVFSP